MAPDVARTVGDLAAMLDGRFPFAWADTWDRVGLLIGEPEQEIAGVLVTLDATGEAIERAADAGLNVVVTHHPPFLEMPARPRPGAGPSGAFSAALGRSVAVLALHTNLDRSPAGAEALPLRLGLVPGEALETGVEEIAVVATYAPTASEAAVRDAMAAAGAGRIGEYARCAHVSSGLGHFEALESASPSVAPSPSGVAEVRIEMICARFQVARVLEAARTAHPYEEPVIIATDALRSRGQARHGRVCSWDRTGSVSDLALHVARTLGGGVRVWGDASRPAIRIATANGSGSSLLAAAARVADVLVTGEVRYHDALDAVADGLAVIEAGHDATEWPLVGVLADAVRTALSEAVPVTADEPRRAWRTMEDANDRG